MNQNLKKQNLKTSKTETPKPKSSKTETPKPKTSKTPKPEKLSPKKTKPEIRINQKKLKKLDKILMN